MRKMKRVFCLLAALLLVLALPAGAVSSAGLTITPETTMEQLRSDPDVAGSGIWTYQQAIADPSTPAAVTTLGEYVGNMAQDCAAAMDYLTDCYRQGRQVTYKVYMAEKIAAEANRNEVELYYFPSHTEKTKYVVVMSGNVLNKTSNLSEGYATAWQLHELGYTVFVLRYPAQRPALTRTLKEHHIPYKEVIYRRATHGVGTGINTDAEGWINDAVAFWEEQTA